MDDDFEQVDGVDTAAAESGVLGVMLDAGEVARAEGRGGVATRVPPRQATPDARPEAWHETLRQAAEATMNGRADL